MEIIIKTFNELTTKELYEILKIRAEVFIVEQDCPYQDMDDKDFSAYHIILKEENKIKGYTRVLPRNVSFPEVSFGRVLTLERKKGYGAILVEEAIKVAKEKFNADKIKIGAQAHAKEFYKKFGFVEASEEYILDYIYHLDMVLNLK